jgi:type VI secretion system protein ImpG
MDPRLLRYYNDELRFMREMGGEFAQEFPKVAGRLGLDGFECADPYVERLLESFAFMSARVQLKIDSQFKQFTNHLLELVYPHYLCPLPSMVVAKLNPDPMDPGLAGGFSIPRGTSLRANRTPELATACQYRTGQDCTLYPVEIEDLRYGAYRNQLGAGLPPGMRAPNGAFTLTLRATAGLRMQETGLDDLVLYLRSGGQAAVSIYQQLVAGSTLVAARPVGQAGNWTVCGTERTVEAVGFAEDEALIPEDRRAFSGYRLLQEYFAFPQRFLFVRIPGLADAVRRCAEEALEIVILTEKRGPELDSLVDKRAASLFCVPAVNLFDKVADPLHLKKGEHEYHVVPDRSRPSDFELYSIDDVVGHQRGAEASVAFRPLYSMLGPRRISPLGGVGHYTARRVPRKLSSRQRAEGSRSSYIGSEVFLSLVDDQQGTHRDDLRQLTLRTTCTNRDLPLLMPLRAAAEHGTDFVVDSGAPIESVRCIAGPTAPRPSHVHDQSAWRLISHLSLNYLSLTQTEGGGGVDALREMLALYADLGNDATRAQIDGLLAVRSSPITRPLPISGPAVFGRGLRIELDFDEAAFDGSGPFLLASILERFLSRFVSINGFTETVLHTVQRGEIAQWPARLGTRYAT